MQLDNKVTPAHVVQLLQGKMHIQGKKVDTELILEEKVHECSDPPEFQVSLIKITFFRS